MQRSDVAGEKRPAVSHDSLDLCARASEIKTHLWGEQTVLLRVFDQQKTGRGLAGEMEGAQPSGEDEEVD